MNKFFLSLIILLFSITLKAEDKVIAQDEDQVEIVEVQENDQEPGIEEKIKDSYTKFAKIQILNKVTAKSQYLEVPVESQITFGTLKVKVLKCLQSSPYELTENKILFDISEKKNGQDKYLPLFNGWMFSSSPSISSLEHAVYDITAVSCYN